MTRASVSLGFLDIKFQFQETCSLKIVGFGFLFGWFGLFLNHSWYLCLLSSLHFSVIPSSQKKHIFFGICATYGDVLQSLPSHGVKNFPFDCFKLLLCH